MSYLYMCQECWEWQKDGTPRLYQDESTGHSKTVCSRCQERLEEDKEDKTGQIQKTT